MSLFNLLFLLSLAATTFARPHNSTHHCHRKNGTRVHPLNTTNSDAGIASNLTYSLSASPSILAMVTTSSTTIVHVAPSSEAAVEYAFTANSHSDVSSSSVPSSTATSTATPTASIVISPSASGRPAISTTNDQTTFVSLHNQIRLHYGANDVTWNNTLANYASTVANKCINKEVPGGPYGENMAWGVGNGFNISRGFASWANEVHDYDWSKPGFSLDTGHFTQVVWKSTSQIGCATASCPDGTIYSGEGQNSVFIVCEYYLAGNVEGDNNEYFIDNVGTYIA
ncbi:MAG: hypothetical protein TREMPRED_003894 [Tremellales sp. Tagirdzhanova-0007]|nr:MAG: hypothetical protein TREMPRED_003894 [Tremellales sp. Tagirdzhanova-0007]